MTSTEVSLTPPSKPAIRRLYQLINECDWFEEKVTAYLEEGLATGTVAKKISSTYGVPLGKGTVDAFLYFKSVAEKQGISVADAVYRYLKETASSYLDRLEKEFSAYRSVREVVDDVQVLDSIVLRGLKALKNQEVFVSPREVIQALSLKDNLLNKYRDALVKRIVQLEDAVLKIIQIISEELPEDLLEKVRNRIVLEVGEIERE
jgi:hypothetical protein